MTCQLQASAMYHMPSLYIANKCLFYVCTKTRDYLVIYITYNNINTVSRNSDNEGGMARQDEESGQGIIT